MTIRQAPCSWPLLGDCPDLDAITDGEVNAALVTWATSYLWRWTGYRYGLCKVTLRPRKADCPGSTYQGTWHGGWQPALIAGVWRNVSCGTCAGVCGCDDPHAIRLPGPVDSVEKVTIDGADLPAASYRVDDHGVLVRHDGQGWPRCQNLERPAGAEGTWSVDYTFGIPVPTDGQLAAGALACQLAKAYAGAKDCQLPERVQTITREGVTVGFLDPFEGLAEGKTGVWTVDAWVASVTRTPQPSRVLSPDYRSHTRTTSPPGATP